MRPRGAARASLWLALALGQPGCVLLTGTGASPDAGNGTLPAGKAAQVSVAVGDSMVQSKHFPEAILQYRKAHEEDPRLDLSTKLARLYAAVGEVGLAREAYSKALAAHPRDADLWNDFGYYHYSLGDWKDAEKALTRATELDPNNARAWSNLGLTLGQLEKYKESLTAFEKVVSPAEARCNLGFIYVTQGKVEQAREAYRGALKFDPRLPMARAALAKLDRPKDTVAIMAVQSTTDTALPVQTIER